MYINKSLFTFANRQKLRSTIHSFGSVSQLTARAYRPHQNPRARIDKPLPTALLISLFRLTTSGVIVEVAAHKIVRGDGELLLSANYKGCISVEGFIAKCGEMLNDNTTESTFEVCCHNVSFVICYNVSFVIYYNVSLFISHNVTLSFSAS